MCAALLAYNGWRNDECYYCHEEAEKEKAEADGEKEVALEATDASKILRCMETVKSKSALAMLDEWCKEHPDACKSATKKKKATRKASPPKTTTAKKAAKRKTTKVAKVAPAKKRKTRG
jgi:hypothetical protein